MEESAEQLSAFVDRVRAATGAGQVDIVGHSEGSLMPDYYVKFLGGDWVVSHYVAGGGAVHPRPAADRRAGLYRPPSVVAGRPGRRLKRWWSPLQRL